MKKLICVMVLICMILPLAVSCDLEENIPLDGTDTGVIQGEDTGIAKDPNGDGNKKPVLRGDDDEDEGGDSVPANTLYDQIVQATYDMVMAVHKQNLSGAENRKAAFVTGYQQLFSAKQIDVSLSSLQQLAADTYTVYVGEGISIQSIKNIFNDCSLTLSNGKSYRVEPTMVLPPKNEVIEGPVEDLENLDYAGKIFYMLLRSDVDTFRDMYIEDPSSGDTVDRGVYLRNKTVEDRLNVMLVADRSSSGNLDTDHLNAILSGQTAYHLIANHGRGMFTYATNDTLKNWYKLPYVSIGNSYWNQGMVEDFTVNGVLYCLAGDLSWHSLSSAVCMVFNKEVCTAIGEEYPYQAVLDGAWDFQKFKTMALKAGAGASVKLDPIKTASDAKATMGYVTTMFRGPMTVLYAGGGSVVSLDVDKTFLELTLDSERNNQIFADFFALNKSNNIHMYNTGHSNEFYKAFAQGNILFFDTRLNEIALIKNYGMETDQFGIVPWPMYDDNVEGYHAWSDAVGNTFGVPKGWVDTEYEFIGAVVEFLCYEGRNIITPKYYANILQSQYSDPASEAMIDLIRDGRRYDIATYMMATNDYGQIGNAGSVLFVNGQELKAWWPTVSEKAMSGLQKINAIFGLLGDDKWIPKI